MTGTLTASLDSITPLPCGTIACIKTYLAREMTGDEKNQPLPDGVTLHRLKGAETARYRAIFRNLGTRWLWWSRLLLDDVHLGSIIGNPAVEAFAVKQNGEDIGLLELDFRDQKAADLAFLGLYEPETGKGLGKALIRMALARVAAQGVRRLTVNTCTFDHPAALGFYRHNGFAVQYQAIEMVPDPRLSGLLPRNAAPHVPLAQTQ